MKRKSGDPTDRAKIHVSVKTRMDVQLLLWKTRRATVKSLGHAGALIRRVAMNSMRNRPGPSKPGTPPHAHYHENWYGHFGSKTLKRAIFYHVAADKQGLFVGPSYSKIGRIGAIHEFGLRTDRGQYPKRPFMWPAFEKVKPRLPTLWAGSISR